MRDIKIGRVLAGRNRPCFIIAEAGVNHNGSLVAAKRLATAAKKAGADAVKFQTFVAEKLVVRTAPKARYQLLHTKATESQFEMLKRLELSSIDFKALFRHCQKERICFLSSPFDEQSADCLLSLGVSAFKIGSGEITNLPFLKYVAAKRAPVILSTGMADMKEVAEAVRAIRGAGCRRLALLHCVSNYPADPRDANLKAMEALRKAFDVPVGFSDHTPGITVAVAAVALGADIIEKHLTLNRRMSGPDHAASLEPAQFADLVKQVRTAESALGSGRKVPAESERGTAIAARRSLVTAVDVMAGQRIARNCVAIKRPGTGLRPGQLALVLGKTARRRIPAGTLISLEALR